MEQRTRMTAHVGTHMKTYNTMTRMTERVGTHMMTYDKEDTRDGTCGDIYEDI